MTTNMRVTGAGLAPPNTGAAKGPTATPSGFAAMGHPVPALRKQAGYDCLKEIGVKGAENITLCIDKMCQALERDKPYEALEAARRVVDLTGAYRIMAVLLTDPAPPRNKLAEIARAAKEKKHDNG